MDRYARSGHLWRIASTVLILTMTTATAASAFTTDARRLGMGNVQVVGSGELSSRNIAFQSMPGRSAGFGIVIPMPLGLVQLATDFPTLDPEDPDFSVTRLANLALNPPFFLETSNPSELDGDISIFVARNEFSILFEDAERLLPQHPIEIGTVYSVPLFGLGLQGVHTSIGPMIYVEGNVGFDDPFYGVLARGESLLPNSEYNINATGETMSGSVLNFGYSKPIFTDERGNGLYAGASFKYLMGFWMGKADTQFSMTTSDTIFGSSDPLDVGYDATMRYSSFGSIGNGIGFDVGAGYRMGAVDFGIGLRDLGTQVHWGSTTLEQARLDEQTNEVVTETLESNSAYVQKIPMQSTFNVAWSGRKTQVSADLTTSSLNSSLHLGAERRLGPLAVRGGLHTDGNAAVQYSWGAGVGFSRLWFDLGFQTAQPDIHRRARSDPGLFHRHSLIAFLSTRSLAPNWR